MKTISILEFRKNARQIVRMSRQGQRMIMTYRGEPIFRLEPVRTTRSKEDDPFYQLDRLADGKAGGLDNQAMDRIVYGA